MNNKKKNIVNLI